MSITKIEQKMMGGRNRLQLALQKDFQSKGFYRQGASLAGNRLVKTLTAALDGRVNEDRYKRSFQEPEVTASVSITLDISGSMDSAINRGGKSKYEEVVACAYALSAILRKMGVEVSVALCDFAQDPCNQGTTMPIIYPLVWGGKEVVPIGDALKVSPQAGTLVSAYAWAAVEMAEQSTAHHRLALYMTDGQCSSSGECKSIARQALKSGIRLVGVVYESSWEVPSIDDHPHATRATTPEEFGGVILHHLAEVVKGKGEV